MKSNKTIIAATFGAISIFACSAEAQVTTYTDQASFAAGTTADMTYGFPFTGFISLGNSYTRGPVTFTTSTPTLDGFNDGYGMPYITDNNYSGVTSSTFTISSTTSALGLFLGSFRGNATYSYIANGAAGTVAVPAPNDTTFLGFANSSGPVSVTFNVAGGIGNGVELDVPQFIAGTAATGAVPEPATWAMMVMGFGVMGYAMRRRVRNSDVRFDAKGNQISEGLTA